jgi:hypothetical protein
MTHGLLDMQEGQKAMVKDLPFFFIRFVIHGTFLKWS